MYIIIIIIMNMFVILGLYVLSYVTHSFSVESVSPSSSWAAYISISMGLIL